MLFWELARRLSEPGRTYNLYLTTHKSDACSEAHMTRMVLTALALLLLLTAAFDGGEGLLRGLRGVGGEGQGRLRGLSGQGDGARARGGARRLHRARALGGAGRGGLGRLHRGAQALGRLLPR